MQITLKDILTTYWAQTVLLIAALGFLMKWILDLRAKKIETKQSIFQQNRNTAIIRFIESYIGLQYMYRQILTQTFDFNTIRNTEFIKSIDEKYEQLYSSYFYFRLFLDPLEQARYADLITVMNNITGKIVDVSTNLSFGNKDQLKGELKTFISAKLKENNDNFKVIGKLFRENSAKPYPIRLR